MIIALINTCGPLFRGIKLLTLVQNSSMEQKPEVVSKCKGSDKSLNCQIFIQFFAFSTCMPR